jgi:hypothetical protein
MLFLYGQQDSGDVDSLASDTGADFWFWDNRYYADTYYSFPNVTGATPDTSQIRSLIFNSNIAAEWPNYWDGSFEGSSAWSGLFDDAALVFNEALTESVVASEGFAASLSFPVTLTESIAADDGFVAALSFSNTLTESIVASDDFTASMSFSAILTEAVPATDGLSGGLLFSVPLSESVLAGDGFGSGLGYSASYSETSFAGFVVEGEVVLAPPTVAPVTGWVAKAYGTGIWSAGQPVRGTWKTGSYGQSVWFPIRGK